MMVSRLCILVAAAWTGWAAGQESEYCSFTQEHTLCKHDGVGPRCGSEVRARGVSLEDSATILALHNQLRSQVARGDETRGDPGPQPSGANIRALKWDAELSAVAQRHADQCVFEHECPNCRRVGRFGVGQNLFISFQSNFDLRVQWSRAIFSWYNEVKDFANTNVQPYQFSQATGHYTQMLWWDTSRVGCGFTMFQEDGWWKKLYTCNYGPSGNIIFSQMYLRGAPCSSCPDGTSCSLEYPGLCEDEETDNPSQASTTVLPPTPSQEDINDILGDFKGFSGLINLNSITPNDGDLQALVEFFNNLRQTSLVTAPTTTPDGTASATTPTTSVPSSTTPAPAENGAPDAGTNTTPDNGTASTTTVTNEQLVSTTTASTITSTSPPQGETLAPKVMSESTTSSQAEILSLLEPEVEDVMSSILESLKVREESPPEESSGINQPPLTLMSVLLRAGRNTQVIRTSSLDDVHKIIENLPEGINPIVLLRSRSNTLTELDPVSLLPISSRAHRSTSSRLARPARLLTCDMDLSPCTMSLVGGKWTLTKSPSEGHHAEIHLEEGEGTQAVVKKVVKAPTSGVACIVFTHRRDVQANDTQTNATTDATTSTAAPTNTAIPDLQVGVMPLGREAVHKSVLGVPGRWEMSRTTFRDLNTPFVVVVSAGPASSSAKVALDALMVTDGPCCLSGRC